MLRSAFKRWKRPDISTEPAGYADPREIDVIAAQSA